MLFVVEQTIKKKKTVVNNDLGLHTLLVVFIPNKQIEGPMNNKSPPAVVPQHVWPQTNVGRRRTNNVLKNIRG